MLAESWRGTGGRAPGAIQSARGGKRRRPGAWGAGVSRRFTRSRAPSTPSWGPSGLRSWSVARRMRRGAATASVSALPARIRPNKYLHGEAGLNEQRMRPHVNAPALGPRRPCNSAAWEPGHLRPSPASSLPWHPQAPAFRRQRFSPPIPETMSIPRPYLPQESGQRSPPSEMRAHVPHCPPSQASLPLCPYALTPGPHSLDLGVRSSTS